MIGKPITALGGGGLKPTIRATSTSGSTITIKENGVTQQSYTFGAEETVHDFQVPLNRIPNPAWRNLPQGYTQVERIYFDGTQYIKSGLQSTAVNRITYKMIPMNASSSRHIVFGTRSASSNAYRIYCAIESGKFGVGWNTTNDLNLSSVTIGTLYDIDAYIGNNSQYLKVNGETLKTGTVAMHSTSVENYIGTFNGNGTVGNSFIGYIYPIKAYLDDTLVADYVPCYNSQNEYGFYDMVSETFLDKFAGNALSGGSEVTPYLPYEVVSTYTRVPEGYTPLSYIQSTGTQWIDSGYRLTSNSERVVSQLKITSNTKNNRPFGTQNNASATNKFSILPYSTSDSYCISMLCLGSIDTINLSLSASTIYTLDINATNGSYSVNVNGTISSGSYSGNLENAYNISLFGLNRAGTISELTPMYVYYFQLYDNDVLVRNFIPCKRNSDNAIGLYDLCGSSSPFDGTPFYGNSGTGTFTAGTELPRLKEQTICQYVDKTKLYPLTFDYRVYLYYLGNECVDTTGGITFSKIYRSVNGTWAKNSDNMLLSCMSGYAGAFAVTMLPIDLSRYEKVGVDYLVNSNSGLVDALVTTVCGLSSYSSTTYSFNIGIGRQTHEKNVRYVQYGDITDINLTNCIAVGNTGNPSSLRSISVYKIWLEQ